MKAIAASATMAWRTRPMAANSTANASSAWVAMCVLIEEAAEAGAGNFGHVTEQDRDTERVEAFEQDGDD